MNRPSSAAASAGTTSSVSGVTPSPLIGTISAPASPASAEPSTQFHAAMRCGEWPSADAASRLSAIADVVIPNVVDRIIHASATDSTTATARRVRRS